MIKFKLNFYLKITVRTCIDLTQVEYPKLGRQQKPLIRL